jgi:glycosyltransferase involved in cell wall biosynthesis
LLVPEGKIDELAGAISRVLGDAGLRERLSRNAIAWASRFNWDNSAEDFARVIGEVADGGRPVGIGDSTHQE